MCESCIMETASDVEKVIHIMNVLQEVERKPLPDKLPICVLGEAYLGNKGDLKYIEKDIERFEKHLEDAKRRLEDRKAKDLILYDKIESEVELIGEEEFKRWYEKMTARDFETGLPRAPREDD